MSKKESLVGIKDLVNEPLAIIGMNCQFPGVDANIEDIDAFHTMLMNGLTPIKNVPENRWDINAYYDADRKKVDKIISKKGGFLNDTHLFDTDFFNISPAEAQQIDPQHRLFLEVSIRALNHANLTLDSLNASNTGVYCGISTHDYSHLNYIDNIHFNEHTSIGMAGSAAAGRLCHFLNLKGPGMVVDTACSSSLTALYLAAMALRTGQCNVAIAGGVHLNFCPENFIGLTKAHLLSPSGKCRSFDSKADGFARSEGCGVVIVKRLHDAINDGDKIHAVIKSIVMNQDGAGARLVAPNKSAQIALHETALKAAQLSAGDIDYIEAHGTGTIIGDSVEFNAIKSIHQGHHSKDKPLIIGAVKTNIGHTLSSSGIASLIKAVCALTHESIPPNLHYSTPNRSISPESIPALLPTNSTPFKKHPNKKRVVQVSNFSFSGTNVSTIIEEPDFVELNPLTVNNTQPRCLIMSANSKYSLTHMLKNLADYLKHSSSSLDDIAYTLINCRDHYKFRCALIVNDKDAFIQKIEAHDYELIDVVIKKDVQIIENDAQRLYAAFLSGVNIRLTASNSNNKIDLPLYYFDRKPYWHEARNAKHNIHWLDGLQQQSTDQQFETIKTKLADQIKLILKKDDVHLHLGVDFETLGFTEPLLKMLDQSIQEVFSPRCKLPLPLSSIFLTLDKLTRHVHQIFQPPTVNRQPSINMLNVEPVAIIGMSCRFPKAANIDEFLFLLERGESGMADIPLDRWDNDKYYDADPDAIGRLYIKQLGLIGNVKTFDADFFNISPREAKLMSPQLRIFMETSYHALEHANLPLDLIKDTNTGVFVGCGTNEYPRVLTTQGVNLDDLNIYFATGNVLNALPGRVAYAFDFHGPIQAIDTACSSSMTAIHNACQSLQSGDCDMAIAGGINILLTPDSNITLSKARMLSPDSRCKTFSDDANGYARSEGCGVIVLKRLSTAIKDNDRILAVIKGSSINSDGKSGGFTAPNGTAQEEVIRSALAKANLTPADIDYIEVHGTGTPLADPIEVNALTRIFSEHHSQHNPLYISSVKTNIGHCESASGVASIIKTVLSLQTKTLFKHLNFNKLNPEIALKNTIIPLAKLEWHNAQNLRHAGVSSFGFSGANAHVILQQAPERQKEIRTFPHNSLLILSAKSQTALELLLSSYQRYLTTTQDEFADICYTAATCRTHFLWRVAIIARTAEHAAAMLEKNDYRIHQIKKENETPSQSLTLEDMQTNWLNGFKINWPDVYKSQDYSFEKVNLPLYEFVPEEHWVEHQNRLKDAVMPKGWCSQLQWENQPTNPLHHSKRHDIQGTCWLLIGTRQMQSYFAAQGLQVVLEEDNYPLNQLDGIIFAAALEPVSATDIDANITFQKELIKKLLNLLKVLNESSIELQLIILTNNAIAELATNAPNLSNSPLVGFCKTLVLELPQYKTILVDLDTVPKSSHDSASVVRHVLDEIHHNHDASYEHMIAYRDGKRLVTRLNKTLLPDKKRSLTGAGRYLITGGCGGLGLVTAQALLSAGARELILTSRNCDKPAVKTAIKTMQANYPGRIIRTINLDVTDKKQICNLLLDINQDGLLKGIVHAAGAAVKASLLDHQDADVDYLFGAKVAGGWYLHELSQTCNLDFFIVYSSIASVFGSNKESVYSATNSFLDALIAERQRLGLVGTAIQWGPWGEAGMAKHLARDPVLKEALLTNEQGQVLIKVLINNQLNHATIISPAFLSFMLDFVPQPRPAFYEHLANTLTAVTGTTNPDLTPWLRDYLEVHISNQFTACKVMVSEICKNVLELSEMDDLDEDEGFFELGFDSLMIAEMANALKKKLGKSMKIMINIGFDYPSINKLSKHLESELSTLQQQTSFSTLENTDDAIAIIGMSCSLPNAPDIEAFETLLEHGLSGIRDIPVTRWDNKKYYDPNPDAPGKSYVTKLALLDNIEAFDANFFGISPREAKLLEPQQRLFLENCYNALENANYPANALAGSLTGVYAGVGPNEYYALLEKSGFSNEELSAYSITGNVLNLIPGRVAYTFDFKGPSLSIDTACSSSLVAIHYACQGLKNRETDYALAGGVNILLMPESNITLCKARALSPEGQCKTFDAHANGYARGEGCGVVLLKRLSDAQRDQDTILAVIKASAVNNDGQSAGLTVPNGKSQEDVMKKALGQAKLSAGDISYIEAHGTGTPLGDPIEVHAINNVYGNQRHSNNPLYIGTVKTNIGHLESASGIAGLIKTVISLQKNKIYKHLNFTTLNPEIALNDTRIALANIDWSQDTKLKCAGVNAFGFSGTNAHVILQESPNVAVPRANRPAGAHTLIISAKSKIALKNLTSRYQHYLETTRHNFSDICFTAATCRQHYTYQLTITADSAIEASKLLETGSKENTNHDPKPQDWAAYYKAFEYAFIKVDLPHYAFSRSHFWPEKKQTRIAAGNNMHPLLGQMLSMPGNEYVFTNTLDLENLSYINHHRVFGKVVFPATAYIELGLAAARAILKCNNVCIEKFNIKRPWHPEQEQAFQLIVKPKNNVAINSERYKINIFARKNNQWHLFCEMEIHANTLPAPESVDIYALQSSFGDKIDISQLYENFSHRALVYGEEFQVLQEGYAQADCVLAKIALGAVDNSDADVPGLDRGIHFDLALDPAVKPRDVAAKQAKYYFHPALLDGAMQCILLFDANKVDKATYVPYAFKHMRAYQPMQGSIWAHVSRHLTTNINELCFSIKLYDSVGLLLGEIEELTLRHVSLSHFSAYEYSQQHLYHTQWKALVETTQSNDVIPSLLVISKDPIKARHVLGNLDYELISSFDPSKHGNKTILFLYEQGQFTALFHCCKTLFKHPPQCFILVTEQAYAIAQDDTVNPYHTMASSFWKSFHNELGLNKNFTIDLAANTPLDSALQYIFSTPSPETQLAIRDSLFIPRLTKKQLRTSPVQEPMFDDKACYLITGGSGGLAKSLIEYLMCRDVKRILLVGRSVCSMATLTLIESARQQLVSIEYYQADASHYHQMEQIIDSIKQGPSPLKGVFHLAGIVHDGLITHLNDDEMQRVLTAKMDSALILHQLTRTISLDMFVMFSSSASLLGARGQSNYVAANGFLDGLAHLRHKQSLPAIAINWGPFQHTGMASTLAPGLEQAGFLPLTKESIDILDVLLRCDLPQISPCSIDWDLYFKHTPAQTWLSGLVKNQQILTDHRFLQALTQQTKDTCILNLSQALCEIATDVLGLDNSNPITAHDNLFSRGLDSLMSLEIRNKIHDKLQCPTLSLPIEYFINDPDIDKIAKHITEELHAGDAMSQRHDLAENSSEEIALSDIQYKFWVLDKLDYSFNIGMQVQLHGKLNKDYLAEAFDFVVRQNSSFWINVNQDRPTQTLHTQGQVQIIYKDMSLSYENNTLDIEFYDNMMSMIPLTQQPLIRLYLYKINDFLHELHMLMPHIIVDDVSCEIVFSQFKTSYTALSLGKNLEDTPQGGSYFNYVKQNNQHHENNLTEKTAFWEAYNKGFNMLRFAPEHHLRDAAWQTQHLFHYTIPSQLLEPFMEWHKTKNLNISSGLITACQLVFYKMTRVSKIPIVLIHSGREGSQYTTVTGLFSESKRVNMTLNEKDTFMTCTQSLETQLLKTAPYQKCSHFIRDRGLKASKLSIGQSLAFAFNKHFFSRYFKTSKLPSVIVDYYLRYFSLIASSRKNTIIKQKFNALFKLNIPLQKPASLRVLISITPGFFIKDNQNSRFANIDYTFPSHFSCANRPIGNNHLAIYFSKDQQGVYQLSINGPLTTECKEQMANAFNNTLSRFIEQGDCTVADLMKN